jgi:hypothetical protein
LNFSIAGPGGSDVFDIKIAELEISKKATAFGKPRMRLSLESIGVSERDGTDAIVSIGKTTETERAASKNQETVIAGLQHQNYLDGVETLSEGPLRLPRARLNSATAAENFHGLSVWKEEDKVFITASTTKVHADPDIIERFAIVANSHVSAVKRIKSFSKTAIPNLLVIAPFSLQLFARRILKVLALDDVPLSLRQAVFIEPTNADVVAKWYTEELAGQWLSLALHIDVYGQPIAAVRSVTTRLKQLTRRVVSILTFGILVSPSE